MTFIQDIQLSTGILVDDPFPKIAPSLILSLMDVLVAVSAMQMSHPEGKSTYDGYPVRHVLPDVRKSQTAKHANDSERNGCEPTIQPSYQHVCFRLLLCHE